MHARERERKRKRERGCERARITKGSHNQSRTYTTLLDYATDELEPANSSYCIDIHVDIHGPRDVVPLYPFPFVRLTFCQ